MARAARVAIALALLCGPAVADEAQEQHRQLGAALFASERYEDALREYEAAWAASPDPALAAEIGRTHQRLGHTADALTWYRRFLAGPAIADDTVRAEVTREAERLTALMREQEGPTPVAEQRAGGTRLVAVRYAVGPKRKLLIAGIVLGAVGYVPALLCGILLPTLIGGSSRSSDRDVRDGSIPLVLPVIGPFVSGLVFREPGWAIPWALFDGALQAIGFGLVIGATAHLERAPVPFTVSVLPTDGGGALSLAGRF